MCFQKWAPFPLSLDLKLWSSYPAFWLKQLELDNSIRNTTSRDRIVSMYCSQQIDASFFIVCPLIDDKMTS